MSDGDAINKALNAVRGLPNPPGITGRAAKISYSYSKDPALQEAFLRGLLGIPDNVAVIIINQEVPVPVIEEAADPNREKKLANLEKARLARQANLEAKRKDDEVEKERQELIRKQRLKNLKKARKAKQNG